MSASCPFVGGNTGTLLALHVLPALQPSRLCPLFPDSTADTYSWQLITYSFCCGAWMNLCVCSTSTAQDQSARWSSLLGAVPSTRVMPLLLCLPLACGLYPDALYPRFFLFPAALLFCWEETQRCLLPSWTLQLFPIYSFVTFQKNCPVWRLTQNSRVLRFWKRSHHWEFPVWNNNIWLLRVPSSLEIQIFLIMVLL